MMSKIAIVKYNAGNVRSVENTLHRLGVDPIITDDPEELKAADKVIFPGVGEASTAMNFLKAKGLDEVIKNLKQPVLGICLGLQLMCKHTEEGDADCLGIFDVLVKRFPPEDKVPHVGWNSLSKLKSPLFEGLEKPYVYFVHSYYAETNEWEIAEANYILPFATALHRDNFYAIQAHPEKSGEVGAKILENFLKL
ncbi:imidazole glycerol phosphate synthase subunit HisH [Persicobacter sp. CCB-QB2]|uniref:imidazole glycerol phosphate synthase subunit HisH n=1 Tax=Persicobacter sp. CCB-QB2 TaxID=1561025 RepID=UPI000A930A57|nr:imidazole glycerol phosphate synthase subunit HisH [Persicobacter sp. CCB-QB2]